MLKKTVRRREVHVKNDDLSSIISLISEIHSSASVFLRNRLTAQGLSDLVSSHGNILFQLSRNKKMTMTELSGRINRDKSTTTALVKKLEKTGYIRREQSGTDSRFVYIKLTDSGKKLVTPTGNISRELVSTCYKGFSQEEKEAVFHFLQKIAENFSRALTQV